MGLFYLSKELWSDALAMTFPESGDTGVTSCDKGDAASQIPNKGMGRRGNA